MARKEYAVVDVVDILRRLQNGYSIRAITRATGMDRNTLRKYLRLACEKGFTEEGSCDLDTIAREVVKEVHSHLPGPERSADQVLLPHKETIASWIENDHLTLTKIHILLSRMGVEASYKSLYRFVSDPHRPCIEDHGAHGGYGARGSGRGRLRKTGLPL